MRALLLASALCLPFAAVPAEAQTLRFMTGPQGGVWVPLGGALKNLWEQSIPGITFQNLPGAGIANVRALDEGRAEIGFGNTISTVDGVQGNPPFPRATTQVCNLASLYPQYFQVVALAEANIRTAADLRGRGVAIQPRGNTAEVVTQHWLRAHGLSYSDIRASFQASYNDAVSMLRDGQAQVFTLGTAIPASSVMDLGSARRITILDLRDSIEPMRRINPGYVGVTIPANTYPGQTQDVTTIGYATHLIVRCDQPEERVFRMVELLHRNLAELANVTRDLARTTPRDMAADIGVPLHPGAARYYRQIGAM
ncbi:MAG: TAXI family TRAP transporter solute-binding subunit [Acetobacteraceae bacterium]|nr:TAXI family TRAP transporter solute-binding subunit [Acetobacteraceae bacterium]